LSKKKPLRRKDYRRGLIPVFSSFPKFRKNRNGQEVAPKFTFNVMVAKVVIGPVPSTFLDKSFLYFIRTNKKALLEFLLRKGFN